jgi:RimJ/RimL family protein N-acetyltransferase
MSAQSPGSLVATTLRATKMNSLPIHTPSLRLRLLVVEESQRMMELNGEPTTRRWLPSHVYEDMNVATARMRYLISCYSSPGDPRLGPYVLAVEHLASGALLGHVGFSPFDDDVEVSYAIAEISRGRGYGAEALLHACRWAAASFHLPGLLALTESDNVPSRRTLERAAFVHAEDTVMSFQGSQQTVSRYWWRAADAPAR